MAAGFTEGDETRKWALSQSAGMALALPEGVWHRLRPRDDARQGDDAQRGRWRCLTPIVSEGGGTRAGSGTSSFRKKGLLHRRTVLAARGDARSLWQWSGAPAANALARPREVPENRR